MRIQVFISIFFFTLSLVNFRTHFLSANVLDLQKLLHKENQTQKSIVLEKKESRPDVEEMQLADDSDSVDYNIVSYSQKLIAYIPKPTPKPRTLIAEAGQVFNPTPPPSSGQVPPSSNISSPAQAPRKEENRNEDHHEEHHEHHGKHHHHSD